MPWLWKSFRLSHNHLENCSAVSHIPTRPATMELGKNDDECDEPHDDMGYSSDRGLDAKNDWFPV